MFILTEKEQATGKAIIMVRSHLISQGTQKIYFPNQYWETAFELFNEDNQCAFNCVEVDEREYSHVWNWLCEQSKAY